ncbi:helix-turn-helix domain-containing protein [Microseira sp. BLCC-F43]|jgi:putative transcriptional regulator|uniref:helix-turn-helix domain-containing protein n=1 Tax=Microseira sp. BLCC-F43 TaxID=3153602 RepID=UPI0035B77F37
MPVEIRLKQVRESRELSQYELAKLIDMSPQNIQKLEQGRAKGIQLDTLDALCEALNCEIQDLLVRVKG